MRSFIRRKIRSTEDTGEARPYYIHALFIKKGSKRKKSILAVLFAISGLICWCGISQVISNSISSSFENAFHVPPIYSTVILVVIAAVIVLRKNATVKVLDIMVPDHGGVLFLYHDFYHCDECRPASVSVWKNLFRGVRYPSGCRRRNRRRDHERSQERAFLQ